MSKEIEHQAEKKYNDNHIILLYFDKNTKMWRRKHRMFNLKAS
jgi:hypothetical protein